LNVHAEHAAPLHHNNEERKAMERQETLRILNALASGANPATGEQFAADSPYQQPDTVRALFAAIKAVEGGTTKPGAERAATDRGTAPPQSGAGSRWTEEEEARLVAAFDAGKTVDDLAHAHKRSRAGIEARLLKLGKIDASAVTSTLRYPPKTKSAEAREPVSSYR
jgi:hypothetical protein